MKQTKISLIAVVFGAFFWLLPSLGEATTKTVGCNIPGTTLQAAINKLKPGDTLQVINGSTCNENVVVNESLDRITLDGLGLATINGPDTQRPTVYVSGRRIVITGFTISGGGSGINVNVGGAAIISAGAGILVVQNSGVTLGFDTGTDPRALPNSTTVGQENGGFGITCSVNSSADGRLGTLNGNAGARNCTGEGSIDSLLPPAP